MEFEKALEYNLFYFLFYLLVYLADVTFLAYTKASYQGFAFIFYKY